MVRLAACVALVSTLITVAYASEDILEREYDDLVEREPFLEFLNIIPKVADVGVGALGQLVNKGISKIKRRDLGEYEDLLEREPFLEFLNIIPKVADVGVGAVGQLINKGISKIKRRELEAYVEGRMSEEEFEARGLELDEFLEARGLSGFDDDFEERSFGEEELEELD
ncbi:hypothetical protein D9611_011561 [Ephemerocybe angulata]|uniref:Antimicrobial peptide n=1 Tax=Ephemerocybe angulata TaxID=980116 RepID=A0A8H5AWL0_9AGAR|nr:hypothetical protein D9611_011561 [Tulosesus angulatus]